MNRQTFTLQNRDSLGQMGKAFRKLYIVCGVIKNQVFRLIQSIQVLSEKVLIKAIKQSEDVEDCGFKAMPLLQTRKNMDHN